MTRGVTRGCDDLDTRSDSMIAVDLGQLDPFRERPLGVGRHCCVGMSFASPGIPWSISAKANTAAAIGTGSFVCMT